MSEAAPVSKCNSESRFIRAVNAVVVQIVRWLPWSITRAIQKRGWGLIRDDHPSAAYIALTMTLPDGQQVDVVMSPDGTVYGLPGSPAEGLKTKEETEAWYERMAALRSWDRE